MKKALCIILSLVLVLLIPLSTGAAEPVSDSPVSLPDEYSDDIIQSYILYSLIFSQNGMEIESSVEEYLENFTLGEYSSLSSYEDEIHTELYEYHFSSLSNSESQYFKEYIRLTALANEQDLNYNDSYSVFLRSFLSSEIETLDNFVISVLSSLSSKVITDEGQSGEDSDTDSPESEEDSSGNEDETDSYDLNCDVEELEKSYADFMVYIRENQIPFASEFEEYVAFYAESGFSSIDALEEFLYTNIIPVTYKPVSSGIGLRSANGVWYYDTGTSLPQEPQYTSNPRLLSNVKKGDIIFDANGMWGLTGHTGIVEGRYYDKTKQSFYVRVIEAISPGVKRSVLDSTRVSNRATSVYRINWANRTQINNAMAFARRQMNKPYIITQVKKMTDGAVSWYCSELVWAAYMNADWKNPIDLDSNRGLVVLPWDIVNSSLLTKVNITGSTYSSLTDVSGHWGANNIKYVVENGIFEVTGSTFKPNTNTTRMSTVVSLHRLEGTPDNSDPAVFLDVATNVSYAEAVYWAASQGIVIGHNSYYNPGSYITREDFACILYRYTAKKGYSTAYTSTSLSPFTDSGSVSSYAVTAMRWAVTKGLISGRTPTTLVPKGNVTNAEAAALFERFVKTLVK